MINAVSRKSGEGLAATVLVLGTSTIYMFKAAFRHVISINSTYCINEAECDSKIATISSCETPDQVFFRKS